MPLNQQILQQQPKDSKSKAEPILQSHQQMQSVQHQQMPPQQPPMMSTTNMFEIPKIGPNQQLFSLNMETNQIKQLNPSLTTTAIGPTERLLIAPAGINEQQLAQCLLQGQIHFNNIGQVIQSDPNKVAQPPQHSPLATNQNQVQPIPTVQTTQLKNTNARVVDDKKPKDIEIKPKRTKGKKNKAEVAATPNLTNSKSSKTNVTNQKAEAKVQGVKMQSSKVFPTVQTSQNIQQSQPLISQQHLLQSPQMQQIQQQIPQQQPMQVQSNFNENKSIQNQLHLPMSRPSSTSSTCTTSQSNVMHTSYQLSNTNQMNQQPHIQSQSSGPQTNAIQHFQQGLQKAPNVVISGQQIPANTAIIRPTMANNIVKQMQKQQQQNQSSSIQQQQVNTSVAPPSQPPSNIVVQSNANSSLPPLVSTTRVVQTIHLTPQKQQALKTVQLQIQMLSTKLQNKMLLTTITIPPDYDQSVASKNLPVIGNVNSMNDNEICAALKRLFIEQQKILATGKLIPTIPLPASPNAPTAILNPQSQQQQVQSQNVQNFTHIQNQANQQIQQQVQPLHQQHQLQNQQHQSQTQLQQQPLQHHQTQLNQQLHNSNLQHNPNSNNQLPMQSLIPSTINQIKSEPIKIASVPPISPRIQTPQSQSIISPVQSQQQQQRHENPPTPQNYPQPSITPNRIPTPISAPGTPISQSIIISAQTSQHSSHIVHIPPTSSSISQNISTSAQQSMQQVPLSSNQLLSHQPY